MTSTQPGSRIYAKTQSRHLRRALTGLLAGTVIAGLGVFGRLCWLIDRTARTDQSRPVDAIIVLGARVNADGSPSEDIIERSQHGITLHHTFCVRVRNT